MENIRISHYENLCGETALASTIHSDGVLSSLLIPLLYTWHTGKKNCQTCMYVRGNAIPCLCYTA